MSGCKGLHCPGCGSGGEGGSGGGAGGVIAALVLLGLFGAAVARIVTAVLRIALEVVEIAAICVASAAGLAVLGSGVIVGVRVRRALVTRQRRRALDAPPRVYVVKPADVGELPVSQPQRPAYLRNRPGTVPGRGRQR